MTTPLSKGLYTAIPNLDQVERAGLDGTLRGLDGREPGECVTWPELATFAVAVLDELVSLDLLDQATIDAVAEGLMGR